MASYSSSERTRTALIQAAGKLFARNGVDRVTTRAIAQEAGENIGNIHYHFRGKEGLVDAVLNWATDNWTMNTRVIKVADQITDSQLKTIDQRRNALREVLTTMLKPIMDVNRPKWCIWLIYRMILTPGERSRMVIENGIIPVSEALQRFFKRLRPDLDLHEIKLLEMNLVVAPIMHFLLNEPLILTLFNEQKITEALMNDFHRTVCMFAEQILIRE